jgi:competence protein ComEC
MRRLLDFVTDRIRDNILISITLCYVTGATFARYWQVDATFMQPLTLAVIVLYLVLLPFHRRDIALLLLLPLFILTGILHTAHSLLPPDDPAHPYNLLPERAKVTMTGKILNMPEYDGQKTRFDLDVDSILFHTDRPESAKQQPTKGKIRLSLDGALPRNIQPGNQIMVLASAGRTYSYRTPGVFDYRLYLADRGTHVSGKIRAATAIIPFQDSDSPWYADFQFFPERWRLHISTFLQTRLDPGTAGIYQALLIGSRAGISDAVLEQFKATGCMHLLAISGIHMSLLGLMITLVLTWIMKRSSWLLLHTHVPTVATLLALLPLTIYAFIAGLNTPVLRSLLMSSLFLIGVVLQRQRSILFIVAAAALLMLIFKPLALFTVSFQLSFASILAIALLYPRLLQKFEQENLSTGNKIRSYISSAMLVSLAASLGTLPFMLFHFNRFSLIGPVMNLAVEPFLCLWALPIGLLAIPLIFIAPGSATLLLKFGSYGILAADKITLAGSKISFASFWTITPSLTEIFIFYTLLFLWMLHAGTFRKKILLATCSIMLMLVFAHGLWFSLPSATAELSFLDVGQGTSTMVRLPNGRTILIDGGSKTSPSFHIGERVIGPFLRKKRVWRLDDVIITHPDSDHANGIDFILERFKPERLWINGDGKESWPYRNILRIASELGTEIIEPETGLAIEASPDTLLTFLRGADTKQSGLSVNDRSLVIRLDHEKKSFLFPGDISKKMERTLVRDGTNLKVDLLPRQQRFRQQ